MVTITVHYVYQIISQPCSWCIGATILQNEIKESERETRRSFALEPGPRAVRAFQERNYTVPWIPYTTMYGTTICILHLYSIMRIVSIGKCVKNRSPAIYVSTG